MKNHARSLHPSNRERLHALLDVLSYLYLINGKPERARDYLRLLVSLRPSESRLLRALAHSDLESGNPSAAKKFLENSLEMEMTHQERAATFLILSRTLLRLERIEEASLAAHQFMNLSSQSTVAAMSFVPPVLVPSNTLGALSCSTPSTSCPSSTTAIVQTGSAKEMDFAI